MYALSYLVSATARYNAQIATYDSYFMPNFAKAHTVWLHSRTEAWPTSYVKHFPIAAAAYVLW